jgi:RNA recognition motif-containing protein
MSQTQNSTNSNSLWIGELDNWMDDNYIINAAKNYNVQIKSIKIMKDKNSGSFLGYGFLEFEDKEMANNALKQLNGQPLPNSNKVFKLNWASYNSNKNTSNPNEYSIYVCDLDPSVNEETLTYFFKEKYNSVISSKIVIDPSTKISKGYGFVKFSDQKESQKALQEMNGACINGKNIKTGTASYKKNIISNNNNNKNYNAHNFFYDAQNLYNNNNNLNNSVNRQNLLLQQQQQQYINQMYLLMLNNPLYFQYQQQLMSQQGGGDMMNNNNIGNIPNNFNENNNDNININNNNNNNNLNS